MHLTAHGIGCGGGVGDMGRPLPNAVERRFPRIYLEGTPKTESHYGVNYVAQQWVRWGAMMLRYMKQPRPACFTAVSWTNIRRLATGQYVSSGQRARLLTQLRTCLAAPTDKQKRNTHHQQRLEPAVMCGQRLLQVLRLLLERTLHGVSMRSGVTRYLNAAEVQLNAN